MCLTLHKKNNHIYETTSTLIADRLREFSMRVWCMYGNYLADARDSTLSCSACTDEKIENPEEMTHILDSSSMVVGAALYRFPGELLIRSE